MIRQIIAKATLLSYILAYTFSAAAQTPAYEIKANIKPFKQGYLFLAHHYGKKQYLVDSARIDEQGNAVFTGTEKLMGGVYMIAYPEKNGWIECMIDREQTFTVAADTSDPMGSIRFTGSPANNLFVEYQRKSFELGSAMNRLQQQLAQAAPDAQASLRNELQAKSAELTAYRDGIMQQHPEHLLSAIFHVLKEPTIPPASQHPGGKYDSLYAYQYYRAHYWDNISLTDERLIRTPVFQQRLERYFGEILPQHPDSLILAASETIDAARTNPEMFKYLLATLTDKYVNPQYMGQDAVFVHLFEKYYIPGQADSWMNEKYKKFIFDRGYSLMANVIGKKAANFDFVDSLGRKSNLYAQNAPYTVLCFWDPTCGHCQEEVPRLDTLFQQKWKKQGVAMIGMMTDGGVDKWKEFIRTKNLKGWVHVYQTDAMKDADVKASRPTFRQLYDVYQTPMLYLLDKEKRIVAKRLNYSQVDELLQLKIKANATVTPAAKK